MKFYLYLSMFMNQAIILLGSNIGDTHAHLQKARMEIEKEIGSILKASSLYVTAPWGNTDQADFLNQVLLVRTPLQALSLLEALLHIEARAGRIRTEKNAARTLDLDILFFNDEIIDQSNLQVPHPRLHLRKFVITPLVELIPEFVHPQNQKSISKLYEECSDTLAVHKLS